MILDIMMPKADGYAVLDALPRTKKATGAVSNRRRFCFRPGEGTGSGVQMNYIRQTVFLLKNLSTAP